MERSLSHKTDRLLSSWLLPLLLLFCGLSEAKETPARYASPDKEFTLGIYTYYSAAEMDVCCQPLVDYLNSRLKNFRLRLKALNLHEIDDALASNELDLVMTNPGHYILLRERYNLTGTIATILRRTPGNGSIQQTGGVIFTRKDREDITHLTDIRGKWIASAGTKHLSAYEAQAYELLQAGILLPRDAHVIETGNYATVVSSVLSGDIDVGFLPAGMLENLEKAGDLSLDDVKVINPKRLPNYPLLISTRLYPHWPIIALPHVKQQVIDEVWAALSSLKPDNPAAIAANIADFAPPADYRSVENIIRALELPPYDHAPQISLLDAWSQHKIVTSIFGLAGLIIIVLLQLVVSRNRQLHTQRMLAEDSASHFEQIIDATQAGTWKWNLRTGGLIINSRWAEMIGYTLSELSPASSDTWERFAHPSDLQEARTHLQKHFRGETAYYEANFRMRHKKGHWVWIHSRGKVTNWEADGSPLWMFGTHMDITERMQASLALQTSQAKYQRLIDNVGEKFIIYSLRGLSGEMTYVSDGVKHVFNLTREEVLGKPWFELSSWLPQDIEKAKTYVKMRMAGQAHFLQFEMRFIHPSGNEHTLRVSSHPVRDNNGNILSIDGIAEDITEQKRSQERARMAATVFAHSQESILITNTDAVIIDCNPAAGRLTGYSREELMGRNPRMLSSGTHTPGFYKHLWQTLTAGRVWQGTFRNLRKNGSPYWIEASISPIKDHDGKITQYVAVSRDITRRKQQLEALRQAKREAQAANNAKSEFVANISHEIRTPMNAILGFTDLCLEGELNPIQRKYLVNVKESAHAMLTLINEILDFSKIEAGKLNIESIPFDLKKELDLVHSMTRQLIHTRNVELQLLQPAEFHNQLLLGDPLRLKQVLTNLTSNAVKFTNNGNIQIAVRELARNAERIKLEFAVCDTGIGMDAEKLENIFQPFSQADTSTTRKFGGTGLGLTISSELVEKMGGTIQVESELGIGSTFYFQLCFPLVQEQDLPAEQADTLLRSFKQLRNTRVLLVEDNEINRELATEVLTRNQLVVDTACNGQEALDCLQKVSYDLVLMDIQMPVMDGYEAAWAIRNQLKLVELPIIALTASTSSVVREKCIRAGMDDYVSKPIDIQELMEKIDKTINPVLQQIAANQAIAPFSNLSIHTDSIAIPGIDSHLARQRLGLDNADYIRLLKKYAANHRDDIKQIGNFLESSAWNEACRLAHTLKGLSSTIGAAAMSASAAQLEQAFRALSGDSPANAPEPAESALDDLHSQLASTATMLDDLVTHIDQLEEVQTATGNNDQHSDIDLTKRLNTLLNLTEKYNVQAVTELNTLLAQTIDNTLIGELKNIQDDLENFDFDSASSGLKNLLVNL
ncbi:MAG TPA: PAS domain S-box protein [Chromatiaceae bacterium]|nr:PAS domain S-box protein [Chromatiaceae bacterium]